LGKTERSGVLHHGSIWCGERSSCEAHRRVELVELSVLAVADGGVLARVLTG
jgi:hypothetical protein